MDQVAGGNQGVDVPHQLDGQPPIRRDEHQVPRAPEALDQPAQPVRARGVPVERVPPEVLEIYEVDEMLFFDRHFHQTYAKHSVSGGTTPRRVRR